MQGRSGLGRCGAAVVCALAIGVIAAPVAQAEKGGGLKAKITRNKQGIPTIEADSYKDLGFGYGYAFAAGQHLRDRRHLRDRQRRALEVVRSRRARVPRASATSTATSSSSASRTRARSRSLLPQAAGGPEPEVKQVVSGYVAGYNRYLQKTGVDEHPRPALRGPALGSPDHRDGRLPALLPAGRSRARASRSTASPRRSRRRSRRSATTTPTRRRPKRSAGAERSGGRPRRRARHVGGHRLERLRARPDATENGGGMVLGNPHFPWDGSERFYQSQLTIPGKVNVTGASLFGVAGDQHRPHRQPRLEPHRLDRVPVHAVRAQARAGRSDQLHRRRPADADGAATTSPSGQAARRVAGARSRGPSTRPSTARS